MNEARQSERSIFLEAINKPSAEERAAFVDAACGNHRRLRTEVEALLRAHEQSGDLLDVPDGNAATIATPITEKPGAQIGPYKLREQIGEGGFGVVYVAEQEQPVARKVALKIIKPGMDTKDVIARFEAERQALALMDHPNVAKVLDAGATESGRPYFVMELVHGLPITEFCDEQKLTNRERLLLFIDVCRAVQHAHQKGIIHRDLKPSNILVTLDDGRPLPKVIDFGVSKALSRKLTEKTVYTAYGQMVGTPLYMAPEQASFSLHDVDTRSDVYSLGVLLYELLTGTTPFDKETLKNAEFDELRRIIREDEPLRPSDRVSTLNAELLSTACDHRRIDRRTLGHSLRGELDWIVMKALEKDRNRRYESASSFAADIERHLNDEPVQACPPSAWYQLRKFARRKRGALTTAGALGLALLVAIGGVAASIGWAVRDREHRREQLAGRVELVLEEVQRKQRAQDWPAARTANQRAAALLADGAGNETLRDRVQQHERELNFIAELQKVREERGIAAGVVVGRGKAAEEDKRYARLFREFGIDVVNLAEADAARKIRAHASIVPAIATVLDDWASSRARWKKDPEGAAELWGLANAVDADPWRNDLRKALIRRDDETLKQLAKSDDVLRQPPTTLWLLGANLAPLRGDGVDRPLGIELLQKAQREYPRDFWLNYYAGRLLMGDDPPAAVAYLQAAHVLRPDVYAAHHNLAGAWNTAGFPERSINEFRKLIDERTPGFWWPHSGIAFAYNKKGDHAQALKHFTKALEGKPRQDRLPLIHFQIGWQHDQLGRPKQAVSWYQQAIRGVYELFGAWPAAVEKNTPGDSYDRSAQAYFQRLLVSASAAETDVRPFLLQLVADFPNCATAQYWLQRALPRTDFRRDGDVVWSHVMLAQALSAETLCRAACEQHPRNLALRQALAAVLEAKGDYPGLVQAWQDAIAADPGWAAAHVELAEVAIRLERWNEALNQLKIARQHEPENPDVLGPLCELLLDCADASLRNPQEGLAIATQRNQVLRNDRLLALAHFRNANWREAQQQLQARSLAGPRPDRIMTSHDLAERYLLAMSHWQLGNEADAVEWFVKAALPPKITTDPRLAPRYHREAVAVIAPEAIVAECTRRLDNDEQPALFLARGEARARLNDFEAAAADFAKALDLIGPGKGWTDPRRIVYQRLAEFPQAVESLAALRPQDAHLWIEVGRYHASLGRWKEAAEAYGKVVGKPAAFNTAGGLRPGVEYAGVLLLSGDRAGYRRLCQQVAKRWGDSEATFQKSTLAWVCSLHADNGIEPAQLLQWAEVPGKQRPDHLQLHRLAIAYARGGDPLGSYESFLGAKLRAGRRLAAHVFWNAIAAQMVGEPAGGPAAARAWYDAGAMMQAADQPYGSELPSRLIAIDEWIFANVVQREAESLLEARQAEDDLHESAFDAEQPQTR